MRKIGDMHVHTSFSIDSQAEMEEMCRAAIDKGVDCICFTDHLDMAPWDRGCGYFDYEKFSESVEQVREKYGTRIQILKGVEFGEPHRYPNDFEALLKKDFDMILGSIHWIDKHGFEDNLVSDRYTLEQVFEKYYWEVLDAIQFGGFNVLAHFDFPKRYLKQKYHSLDILDDIFYELSKTDIVLEINTSPLRKGFCESCPDSDILERYVKAGGRRVTFGSDAHRCEDIAADFDYAYELVTKHGVEEIGIFKNRRFEAL